MRAPSEKKTQSQGLKKSAAKICENSDAVAGLATKRGKAAFDEIATRNFGGPASGPMLSQFDGYWRRRIAGRAGFKTGSARKRRLESALSHVGLLAAALENLSVAEIGRLLAPDTIADIGASAGRQGLVNAVELNRLMAHLKGGLARAIQDTPASAAGHPRTNDLVREAVSDLLPIWAHLRGEPASQSKAGFGGFAQDMLVHSSLGWNANQIRHAVADIVKAPAEQAVPEPSRVRTEQVPRTQYRVLILDAGHGLALETVRRAKRAGLDVIATTDDAAGFSNLTAIDGVQVLKAAVEAPSDIIAGIGVDRLHALLWIHPLGGRPLTSGKEVGAALDRVEAVRNAVLPLLADAGGPAGSFVATQTISAGATAQRGVWIEWNKVGQDGLRCLLRCWAGGPERSGEGYGIQYVDPGTEGAPARLASAGRLAQVLQRSPNQWNGKSYSEDGDPSAL